METALDIDMVSAACPKCSILVIQATDNAGDGLYIAQNAAAALGATVISNSWGGPEQANTPPATVAMSEAYFNHPNIAIFVSAGDDGYSDAGAGPDYPATSSHAIAVGGTRLVKNTTNARGWSETAWVKGGSACSLLIPKPVYQTKSPCAFKATADIAAVGDPATGLAVYNAKNGGWITVGGTSASSPFVASIFAATGNGTQTSGSFISSKASMLYDVTSGTNGTCGANTLLCTAAAGWDGPTGYGTPNAALLMPATAPTPAPARAAVRARETAAAATARTSRAAARRAAATSARASCSASRCSASAAAAHSRSFDLGGFRSYAGRARANPGAPIGCGARGGLRVCYSQVEQPVPQEKQPRHPMLKHLFEATQPARQGGGLTSSDWTDCGAATWANSRLMRFWDSSSSDWTDCGAATGRGAASGVLRTVLLTTRRHERTINDRTM